MASKRLQILISGDAKGAIKALRDTGKAAEESEGKFSKISGGIQKAGLVAGTFGVAAAGGLFKLGESFDESYDKIRVGTGATGKALDRLKGSFKTVFSAVPTNMADASTAISDLNTRLGLTGKPLEKMAEQQLELARITKTDLAGNITATTGAFNNFGVGAGKQSAALDTLFKASQATGVSVADLATQMSQGGTVLRSAGLDFGKSAALIGLLGKSGIQSTDVIAPLARALATAAKEGKPASKVIADTFAAIKGAKSDTAAAGDAVAVFGSRAGPKLAAAIREGKLSYQDLAATIAGSKETILKAGSDTQDFGEKWTLIKNRVLTALEPLATRVFNGIGKLMDKLGPKIQQLTKWLGKHKIVLIALAAVVGVVVVSALTMYIAGMISAAAATIAAAAPILAVVAVLALLVLGVKYAWKHWGWFRDAVHTAAHAIAAVAQWMWRSVIQPVFRALQAYVSGILIPQFHTFMSVAQTVFHAIAAVVQWVWTNVLQPQWSMIHGGLAVLSSAFYATRDAVQSAFSWIGKTIEYTWNRYIAPVWYYMKQFLDTIGSIGSSIGGVLGHLPGLSNLHFAGGTNAAPGGWSWVGERGPELVNLRPGAKVMTAHQSAAVSRGGGGRGGVTVVVNVAGHVTTERQLVEFIRTEFIKAARSTPGKYLPGVA